MQDLSNTRSTFVGNRRVYLMKVARIQRTLIWLVLAYMLLQCSPVFAFGTLRSVSPATGQLMLALYVVAQLGIWISAIVQTIRLSSASGTSMVVAAIAGALMIIPFFGMLALVVVNVNATALLKHNGVRVGFFGVAPREMQLLVEGACIHCGYDVRGLPGLTCPECGTALTPPPSQAPAV